MTFLASFPTSPGHDLALDTQLYTMIDLEGSRYRAFFAKLTTSDSPPLLLARKAAVQFFCKSSLSLDHVHDLYNRIKELQLLRDINHMNETEFVLGMHFIVCMTKRKLETIPRPFPKYLFPTLDLTPERPMEEHMSLTQPRASDALVSFVATSSLADAKSLLDLLTIAGRTKQEEVEVLSSISQLFAEAELNLKSSVERVSDQVDKLGYSVPRFLRTVDALEDLKNLMQQHVLATKHEIQSIQEQEDKETRNVTFEVEQDSNLRRKDPLDVATNLTQELVALQLQTTQLVAKKANLDGRLAAVKAGASTAGSSEQRTNGVALNESKNTTFALSKGALTVGELGTALASTAPSKSSELVLTHSRNAVSCKDVGTHGTAASHVARPAQAYGLKIEQPPTSNDPFDFVSSPAVSSAADALEFKTSAWDLFQ
uniref:EH domain-containing protein n=1 Tax=Hyaloperonospora arabidopsidis (strain Emoy2) TaxID=559515 RepID=M4BF39_HYAAE